MQYTPWTIRSEDFTPEKRQSLGALFLVSNGYFGVRGFVEEDPTGEMGNGCIFVAGVNGDGADKREIVEGKRRDLCNITNVLRLRIAVDGEVVDGIADTTDAYRLLDMKTAVSSRHYIWKNALEVDTLRFADMANVHRIGQRTVLRAQKPLSLTFHALLDSNVYNHNFESCEPMPIQPGLNHIVSRTLGDNRLSTRLDDEDSTTLYAGQQLRLCLNGTPLNGVPYADEMATGRRFDVTMDAGDELVLEKLAAVYTDKECPDAADLLDAFMSTPADYAEAYAAHCAAWEARWAIADVQLDTETDDQTALRYNLFQLMGVCPMHTDRVSIGARGLTGEMYEGCVFWDNEIFQLPFFVFTDPAAARRLLAFRYHNLPAAKRLAAFHWFEGAMFPWESCEKGREQTALDHAYYSIHIVGDIAYAIRQYVQATGDLAFLWEKGAEILLETSRFWVSRVDYSKRDGHYHLFRVRGPNEYDHYVDDNAFTNYLAAENLHIAVDTLTQMKTAAPEQYRALCEKTGFQPSEMDKWNEIAGNLYVAYDEELHLVGEDSTYMDRRPLDLKRAKPTAKRILESGTMTYQMMTFYQLTKQSDTVTLMCLLPEKFTEQERIAAYDYYEPRTAHDSSLSYAPYAWMAARLGKVEQAYDYFKICAYLDIADLKLNTISGLHFANFGGTWQATVFGFGGAQYAEGVLRIDPHLPDTWNGMRYRLCVRGGIVSVDISGDRIQLTADGLTEDLPICVGGQKALLNSELTTAEFRL
ncbi:MAG: glycoside hydrolase family 65 protein [Clostridia bacterium]|nr:glycoside hydrolase family 65 protein [Clostridia bacterium]